MLSLIKIPWSGLKMLLRVVGKNLQFYNKNNEFEININSALFDIHIAYVEGNNFWVVQHFLQTSMHMR
jgi:hypothetical protein